MIFLFPKCDMLVPSSGSRFWFQHLNFVGSICQRNITFTVALWSGLKKKLWLPLIRPAIKPLSQPKSVGYMWVYICVFYFYIYVYLYIIFTCERDVRICHMLIASYIHISAHPSINPYFFPNSRVKVEMMAHFATAGLASLYKSIGKIPIISSNSCTQ